MLPVTLTQQRAHGVGVAPAHAHHPAAGQRGVVAAAAVALEARHGVQGHHHRAVNAQEALRVEPLHELAQAQTAKNCPCVVCSVA